MIISESISGGFIFEITEEERKSMENDLVHHNPLKSRRRRSLVVLRRRQFIKAEVDLNMDLKGI